MISDAWRDTVNWYIANCRNWDRVSKLFKRYERKILDEAYGLWGRIWHEHDLVLVFGHRLLKLIEEKEPSLHIHIIYPLKPRNFSYFKEFSKALAKSIEDLRKMLNLSKKWYPEIDLIVSRNSTPFEWCIEFKYYHYLPYSWNIVADLKRKIVVLETLKKHKVCREVAVMLLDDIICRRDRDTCLKLRETLDKASIRTYAYYVGYEDIERSLKHYLQNNKENRTTI